MRDSACLGSPRIDLCMGKSPMAKQLMKPHGECMLKKSGRTSNVLASADHRLALSFETAWTGRSLNFRSQTLQLADLFSYTAASGKSAGGRGAQLLATSKAVMHVCTPCGYLNDSTGS